MSNSYSSFDSFGSVNDEADNDESPVTKTQKIGFLGADENAGLNFETIRNILAQREKYALYKKEQIKKVWGDESFNPDSALNKIALKIALSQANIVAKQLEEVCDNFIDSLVHSEFFPED